ncbi:hypothetical protein GCM10007036_18770 [Alsobacter metallidurans]|uniref:Response regulatory domain-containing protein n=1 Tax=Alsobacter metallidurans TaxID=340221 RepID=A0A917I6Z7_9HYPH|nr:response regulator [Alsobacter metallidurans]GGH17379.1 hypothetical protein GCM10007036_18770 [Alsobacter metallidurans]
MNAKPRRILVVDDDVLFQKIALRVLADPASEIVIAQGGAEAIGLLEIRTFDLAIIDLGMPEVGGFAVIRAMKQDTRLRNIPILVITGNHCGSVVSKAVQLGVGAILPKPVRWRALPSMVEEMLDRPTSAV